MANPVAGMDVTTGPARVGSLVIELAARTAKVDGVRVEFPETEFALLAALATRPGEVVSNKKLGAEAFGEAVPVTDQEIHWRIWKLRKLLGDQGRDHQLVANRRGQGYVLDLPPSSVRVVKGVAAEPVLEVEATEPQPVETSVPMPIPTEVAVPLPISQRNEPGSARTRGPWTAPRPVAVLLGVLVALAAVAGSWSAGYIISSRSARTEIAPAALPTTSGLADGDEEQSLGPQEKKQLQKKRLRQPSQRRRTGGRNGGGSADASAALAPPPAAAPAPEPLAEPGQQSAPKRNRSHPAPAQPRPAPLPAAPTRYLYHLIHPNTGDHYVTTDGNVASQQEARGYQGGAVGRVYTSSVEGTRAISTNQGTAYIFISASPRTEPPSRTLPLWYSTNNDGDFFYTTNENEARQAGWTANVVGYVRNL